MANYLLKIKELFFKKRFLIFVLISLVFFQLIFSFSFPAVGSNDNWLSIDSYLPKFQVGDSDNFLLSEVYPLISSEYRLSGDVGNYLELALNFTPQYFENHVFLNRPLYPFLISLTSIPLQAFLAPSYGLVFVASILLNFILISLAVVLFFLLLKNLFSLSVAFFSSVLLIFSPSVHIALIQPLAEMLMIFAVSLTAYLLYNYIKKPSIFKLMLYSLVVGVLMLGKMFFAISFFILLLALFFKRYKEGIIFSLVHLIPLAFWYLWVTQVWKIPFFFHQVQDWGAGVWIFNIFLGPWHKAFQVLLAIPFNFIEALIYGFILIPLLFSIIGFKFLPFKSKNIFYFGPFLSLFALFFVINLYLYYHAFLLYPIIYPTAILGIGSISDSLKKYRPWFSPVFYILTISLIIIISNVNIFKFFDWFAI
ncbi:MAG TPA: glycosyltransferase family 39 protein [Candidatus Parcubacteria bacterium]|nr:glycosyltransferase family 39 protein [Candidatus Parcubacteria bacterium]